MNQTTKFTNGFHTSDDGCKIYYELHGCGWSRVVMISGFHASCLMWKLQLGRMDWWGEDILGGCQVLVLDNRGYGRSEKPSGLYDIVRMAKDVYSVITKSLGWKSYHIVGHSMGGMIAQELVLLDENRVESLMLYATHAGGMYSIPPLQSFWWFGKYLRPYQSVKGRVKALLHLQYPERYLMEQSMVNGGKGYRYLESALLEDMRVGGGLVKAGTVGQFTALARHYMEERVLIEMSEKLKKRKAPILVLTGTEDGLVRTVNSEYLSRLLNCQLIRIEGGGHMIHWQCEKEFNIILKNHLSQAIEMKKRECLSDGRPWTEARL